MACCKCVVPCMCPEMPEKQKAGLAYAVMQPLVYTNVQIRNWTAFEKLGVRYICSPEGILLHDFGLSRHLRSPVYCTSSALLAVRDFPATSSSRPGGTNCSPRRSKHSRKGFEISWDAC